eukprot:Skav232985  [mRNA]  locus=scaffold1735:557304:559312:+ [translate_table: standard]
MCASWILLAAQAFSNTFTRPVKRQKLCRDLLAMKQFMWWLCLSGMQLLPQGFKFHDAEGDTGEGGDGRLPVQHNTSQGFAALQEVTSKAATVEIQYIGGYIYSTREAAESGCQAAGFKRLCSKAEMTGA